MAIMKLITSWRRHLQYGRHWWHLWIFDRIF